MNRARAHRRQGTTRDRCVIGQADLGTGESLNGTAGVREGSACTPVQIEDAAIARLQRAVCDQPVDTGGVYEESLAVIVGVNDPTCLIDDADATAEVTASIRITLNGIVDIRQDTSRTGKAGIVLQNHGASACERCVACDLKNCRVSR